MSLLVLGPPRPSSETRGLSGAQAWLHWPILRTFPHGACPSSPCAPPERPLPPRPRASAPGALP
eukprot:3246908-Prymnesium_polylepis.1